MPTDRPRFPNQPVAARRGNPSTRRGMFRFPWNSVAGLRFRYGLKALVGFVALVSVLLGLLGGLIVRAFAAAPPRVASDPAAVPVPPAS